VTVARPRLRTVRPGQIVLLGFAVAILAGTALLLLPIARAGPESPSFTTALFTATSAVCVTGHVVVDTASYWSVFGQVVIMLLVQIGGFGIVTATTLIFTVFGRRLGLRGRLLTQAESQALGGGDVRRVLAGVAIFTLTVEAAVAAVLTLRLHYGYDLALGDAVWRGVFHAVTAYNNAGFALYRDNLMGFVADWLVVVPIGFAVIVGALGYPVFVDLQRRRRGARTLTLHSKITLAGSGALLLVGAVAYAVLEWTNERTLGALPVHARVLESWFMSLTPRTAGFNTLDISALRDESWLVTDVLMFIGGGTGSTAGGIKVATFVVLVMIVMGEARGGRPAEVFQRTIPVPSQRQALSVAFLAINAVVIATLALLVVTPFPLEKCLFEVISAFSTVGLSTGITADLGTAGEMILVALMYVGRVGPLALVLALAQRERERLYALPQEHPLIG